MKTDPIQVIFDRKKRSKNQSPATVEIVINLSRMVRKYIVYGHCTPTEWLRLRSSRELVRTMDGYRRVVASMEEDGSPMTIEELNERLGVDDRRRGTCRRKAETARKCPDFLTYMREYLTTTHMAEGTRRQKTVTFDALSEWGGMRRWTDVTPERLRAFDKWLRRDGSRQAVTVHNYHKNIKTVVRQAIVDGYLRQDPYLIARFERGKSKERQPLTEEELARMRDLPLRGKLAKTRDLFVFSAYTGLSYADMCLFRFDEMTEERGGVTYIDGSRLKTGTPFFTPILPPAMEVLRRHGMELPRVSNQKLNDYLKVIAMVMDIRQNLTFHIARHSFATLLLSHDVPIEKVARMLGHKDVKTTQIYAKILKSTIERHTLRVIDELK